MTDDTVVLIFPENKTQRVTVKGFTMMNPC